MWIIFCPTTGLVQAAAGPPNWWAGVGTYSLWERLNLNNSRGSAGWSTRCRLKVGQRIAYVWGLLTEGVAYIGEGGYVDWNSLEKNPLAQSTKNFLWA